MAERRGALRWFWGVAAVAVLSGCAVTPEPLTPELMAERVQADAAALVRDQLPLTAPLTLYDCMARAISYNFGKRLRAMETALSLGLTEQAQFEMLPSLVASAGYTARSNQAGSESESLRTGRSSLEPSTSQEQRHTTASLAFTWNILDFGVSYLRARQQANRALIAEERRRKATQTIIQEVWSAFWRAVVFERLQRELVPLEKRIDDALEINRRLEQQRLKPLEELLEYRKSLLDVLREIQVLRRDIASGRLELAGLMNVPQGQDFSLQPDPPTATPVLPDHQVKDLVSYALLHRPELREEHYQTRISADEAQSTILSLLPGINLTVTGNFDSNRFLVNNLWAEAGSRITWSLVNLLSAPTILENAEMGERVAELRRQSVHLAVATQVQVAWLRMLDAHQEARLAEDMHKVNERLYQLAAARQATATGDELTVIRREAARLFSQARTELSKAESQSAIGSLLISIGVDPLPSEVEAKDLAALADDLKAHLTNWRHGLSSVPGVAAMAQTPPPQVPAAQPAPPAPVAPPAPIAAAVPVPAASVINVVPDGGRRPSEQALLVLGMFRNPANAEVVRARVFSQHPNLAAMPVRVDTVAGAGGGVFHRLAVVGELASITQLCHALSAEGTECLVRRGM